ncbi:MAG: hypothetical protein WCJ09_24465, partial [Planctomycetota bacterium]
RQLVRVFNSIPPKSRMNHNKNFSVYVWKSAGDNRVPVYGSTWTDSTDVFFDLNKSNVQKFAADTKKALNVERRSLGQLPLFYVYPLPDAAKPAKPEAKSDSKPDTSNSDH